MIEKRTPSETWKEVRRGERKSGHKIIPADANFDPDYPRPADGGLWASFPNDAKGAKRKKKRRGGDRRP